MPEQPYPVSPIKGMAQRRLQTDFREFGPYGFDPMDYCRKLREQVENGQLDFYVANNLWRNYKKSLEMIYVNMPKLPSCLLGPEEAPTEPAFDVGYYDSGLALSVPDAVYAAKEKLMATLDPMTRVDPMSWLPIRTPQIALPPAPIDDESAFTPYEPNPEPSGGFESYAGEAPAPGPRTPVPQAAPAYAPPQPEVMARGPDGTYYPVLYRPMPSPQPPPVQPALSPYEGVPVTASFGIKD